MKAIVSINHLKEIINSLLSLEHKVIINPQLIRYQATTHLIIIIGLLGISDIFHQ